MKHRRGVVIGKFLPPHGGHSHLIESALGDAEHVTVIVCWRPTDPIPGPMRAEWIRRTHPGAHVMVIDDAYDENDTKVWAENTIGWLGGAPDVVHTSEDYGESYALAMGSAHVLVDRARTRIPVSATAIRRDPYTNWDYLMPPARGWFAKRVCIVGAESTGTTTLAEALAARLDTSWVAEYGRERSAEKAALGETDWTSEEFETVAREQNRRENEAALGANRVLVCDTNAFATVLWHRRYMGEDSAEVARIASECQCALYILTGDEIPFVQDGLRDGEHIRHEMHSWFEEALAAQEVPWIAVRGTHEARMADALRAVGGLFEDSRWRPGACGGLREPR